MQQRAAVRGERLRALPGAGERADGAEVADQDTADQAVVADEELAVGAPGGVGEPYDVVTGAGLGPAEGGEIEGAGVEGGGAGGGQAEGEPGPGPERVRRVRERVPV